MARQVITKILIPAAAIVESCDLKSCKRSELPIYIQEVTKTEETDAKPISNKKEQKVETTRGAIEETIGNIRLQITKVKHEIEGYEDKGMKYINEGVANAKWLIDFLGDEENLAPKAPAIAIGGLAGFIFALRGGFFKKLIYTTAGATAMASICYPKEASEYSKIALEEGKQYATIAYNFAYGVKKDDPPLELPSLPKLPASFSEAWTMISNQSSTVSVKEVSEGEPAKVVDAEMSIFEDDKDSIDSNAIISGIHDEAIKKQCHCPVGACLNKHDEEMHPAVLPYPPPVLPPEHFILDNPECPPCPPCETCPNPIEKPK